MKLEDFKKQIDNMKKHEVKSDLGKIYVMNVNEANRLMMVYYVLRDIKKIVDNNYPMNSLIGMEKIKGLLENKEEK